MTVCFTLPLMASPLGAALADAAAGLVTAASRWPLEGSGEGASVDTIGGLGLAMLCKCCASAVVMTMKDVVFGASTSWEFQARCRRKWQRKPGVARFG